MVSQQMSIKKALSFHQRLAGLMFKKELSDQEGLYIQPCNSIHTCFMRFSIDVVFLSKEKKVVKIIENIAPWKFIAPVKGAHGVLELNAGIAQKLNIHEGEFLDI